MNGFGLSLYLTVDNPVMHGLVGFLFRQSGWTSSMDVFFNWLSTLTFEGGGFNEAAIAEALAEALMVSILTPSCMVLQLGYNAYF